MVSAKSLFLSHSFVFLAGFAAGKMMDYEELAGYRERHESFIVKWRRRLGSVAIGAAVLTLSVAVFKVVMRSSTSSPPSLEPSPPPKSSNK
mmetsp:Transcript_2752/g.7671  ORF Transcript_2752/g.7671 Transcript_2752/m.7671 type:complete len:91 (+) Transcript_2752:214-486(+)